MSIESYLSAIGGEVTNQADQLEIARTMLLNKAAGGGEDMLAKWCRNEIESYSSDEVINVPSYFAYYNLKVKSISLPNCTSLSDNAFNHAQNLEYVYLPNVKSVGVQAFDSTKITSYDFSKTETISTRGFQNCTLAGSYVLPVLRTLNTAAFINTKITALDIYNTVNLPDQLFSGCTMLTRLVLRGATPCTCQYASVFNNTPFAVGGTGGTVYVPSALIDSYETATNWKTLFEAGTCNFVALEGSAFE